MTELRKLIDRHCRQPVTVTAVPRLMLSRMDGRAGRVDAVYMPMLCVIVDGSKQVLVGDRSYTYDPATYLVASADLPATCRVIGGPCLGCVLMLDPAAISALLLDLPPIADAPPTSALAVEPLGADLLDPLTRLVRLLDRPQDAAVLAPLAEREILYRLLHGPRGPMLRQLARPDSQLSAVRRAVDMIRRRYDQPLSAEGLARVAGMSVTSFNRHFRAVTAMSPLQYQKQLRLLEARGRLLGGGDDAATVAYAVGYQSPSQFSREYRRRFGAPPARDAGRMRATV